MIQNKTARQMFYDWHGGQFSPFYAVASSGLVQDWDELLKDCECIKGSTVSGDKATQCSKLYTFMGSSEDAA